MINNIVYEIYIVMTSYRADRFCHPFVVDGLIMGAIKFHAIINNKLQYIDARADR